jgi:signal transduction histidine kinase
MWSKIKQKSGSDLIMFLSGLIIFMIAALAFIGLITNNIILASVLPDYIPMSQSTAIIFMIFGTMMFLNRFDSKDKKTKFIIIFFATLITISGFLHFIGYFIHRDLTFEQFLFTRYGKVGNFQINRMSHYGGLLFLLSGIALLLKYFGKERTVIVNIVGTIGLLIAFAGFITTLGYSFGTPFLYSGTLIPLALTSAICYIFLGGGVIIIAGKNNYILHKLLGTQASARILRAFIPFLILENVIGDLLEQYISTHFSFNEAFISASMTIASIVIAVAITLYLTKRIFKSADMAEAERLNSEAALKESLEIRNTLLKTIPFGMDIIDETGTILFQNDLLKSTLGRVVIGAKCWDIYRDDKSQCIFCPMKKGIKTGYTETCESHDMLGGRIFEIIHTGLIFNGKKAILEIFNDVTERKQSEIYLKKYAGELEVANNTKVKLFNIIAHDLRSPFNSIIGLTQLLNERYESFSEYDKKKIILKLKEASENTFNLLENLLAWSLSQRDGIQVKPEMIDLYEIASLQMDLFVSIAHNKNIMIKNQIISGTSANADRSMVTTIIRNLLNNALKFTPSGGIITFTSFEKKDKIGITIMDTGVGMESDILNSLFKLSEMQSTAGTANEKGTGLGLMVSKEFVEKNGGEIRVESQAGKGSKFTFTLPVSAD